MTVTSFDAMRDLGSAHARLALVGPLGAGKTTALRSHYRHLLRGGLRSERALVWIANSAHAGAWRDEIKAWDFSHGAPLVMTFRSWVRQELQANWARVEASGLLPGSPPRPEPFFVGISAAQQLMRLVAMPLREEHPVLEDARTALIHQFIQTLDTHARLAEHGLPAEEATTRLDRGHWLGPNSPALHAYVGEAIAAYRSFCLQHRVLDHTLQLELFRHALWPDRAYREALQRSLDVLIVDNVEETIPVAQDVIATIGPSLPGLVLARDLNGGLREYLGGDVAGAEQLLLGLKLEMRTLPTLSPLAVFGEGLAGAALAGPDGEPPPAVSAPGVVLHAPRTLRVQMFEDLTDRIGALLEAGVRQGEIVVVAPVVDPLLTWHLRQRLAARGLALRVSAGSNRVIDHRPVRILVTLCRLCRPAWKAPPSPHDVAEMLEVLLGLHPLEAIRLQQLVYPDAEPIAPAAVAWPRQLAGCEAAYAAVHAWIEAATGTTHPLDRLFESAFSELYAPRCLQAMAPGEDGRGLDWCVDDVVGVLQVDQLIEGARSFRHLAASVGMAPDEVPKHFLRSIYAGELAERPLIPKGVLPEAVTLFTAAKYAEEGPRAAYQLWTDAASPQWHKSDVRELTNPRVLSRRWPDRRYEDEDDLRDQADKLARTLHTVVLKATRAIEVFASDYSSDGTELGGDLATWLAELAGAGGPEGGTHAV